MAKVKCLYCGKDFDPQEEEYEKPRTNRYAHKKCCTDDNKDYIRDKIKLYAKSKIGDSYNWTKVNRQIKNYEDKLFLTPMQIYQSLIYWYDVLKSPSDKANGGIGIVESIWPEAQKYYGEKQKQKEKLSKYNLKDYIGEDSQPIVVRWEPPAKPKNYKIIELK